MRRIQPNLVEEGARGELHIQQQLGLALDSLYRNMVAEPLPERFRLLLEQLDAEEQLRSGAPGPALAMS